MRWAAPCVSPSVASLDDARMGRARRGTDRLGVAEPSTEGLRAFPAGFIELRLALASPGMFRQGVAWCSMARSGQARLGWACFGNSCDSSTEGHGSPCCSLGSRCRYGVAGRSGVRRVPAWLGMARPAVARHGMAPAADSSAGGFGSLRCSHWRADKVRMGALRLGSPGCGMVVSGPVRQGLISALSHSGLSAGFSESRHGTARSA